MALSAGTMLGPYEVLAPIGAGGMGEVWKARDTNLNRDVALKILPDAFALDPDRLARFKREAQVLASLNHPNIGAIHGLEESDGTTALVLELVEGPTLADRIAQGPLPLDEALPIAKQIAEALEAAHEQGIIHRDLKPANIKVRADGTVKVLDFGLAKALTHESGSIAAPLMNSPTITSPSAMTGVGVLLGTAAYMSPEQAKGRPADRRSDIWAFGCVLFEMLTGRAAFARDTVSGTIAAIIEREPDFAVLPIATPLYLRTLVRRCLEKDRQKRLPHIGIVRIEIDEEWTTSVVDGVESPTVRPPRIRIVALAAAGLALAALGAVVALATRTAPPQPRVSRLLIVPPSPGALTISSLDRDLAITPDGSRVVYVGANGTRLFVRALDQLDATPLTGLGTARGPFISPDGQWVGFFDATTLKKVTITGGPTVTLGQLDGVSRGASWSVDGSIVFATVNATTGLMRIDGSGGDPTVLTRPNRIGGEAEHLWPEVLPDGQAVIFTITATTGGLDQARVAVLDLRTGTQSTLIRGGSDAHYVPSGHLLYSAAGTLRAVGFDLARRTVVGVPVSVGLQAVTSPTGTTDAVVASDGTLVYVPAGSAAGERTLVWTDRQGHEDALAAPPRTYILPRLSPDGTRLVVSAGDQENDLWLWTFGPTTTPTRLTFDPSLDSYPVWARNGRQLFFSSEREGARNLFAEEVDRPDVVERLTESPNVQNVNCISPDGKWLVFTETRAARGVDLMGLQLDGERRVMPLVSTPATERNGEISPDGRWLAYEADDSRQLEIYVRPFPDVNNGRWQVSTGGGNRPVWARDGQELFYLAPDGALMRVGVEGRATWTASAPTKLLDGGRYFTGIGGFSGRTYDVAADGRRFLMIKPRAGTDAASLPTSLVVVQHWAEELKRLVPTK